MDSIHEIATRILSSVYTSYFELRISNDDRVIMEAVRNASLELAIRLSSLKPSRSSPLFTKITRLAELHDTNVDDVLGLTKELVKIGLESSNQYIMRNLEKICPRDMAELLGTLHSLGSHTHPSRGKQLKTLRPMGSFYTPREITDAIVSLTIDPLFNDVQSESGLLNSISFTCLDPACGPGGFLVSAYYRILQLLPFTSANLSKKERKEIDIHITSNLYGVDIDAAALQIAAISLECVTGQNIRSDLLIGHTLKQGDALISADGLDGNTDHSRLIYPDEKWLPFEWPLEFPEIFSREPQGFDIVVMNPPYERLKPNFAEFLRERVGFGERTISTAEFDRHHERMSHIVTYFRRSPDYKFANRYTIDTHRLFIERALHLLRPDGRLGLIVPTSILGDLSAQSLRRHILYENTLEHVIEFPESARVFPGVTQAVSILVMRKGGTTHAINIRVGIEDITSALIGDSLCVKVSDIESVMGDTANIPQIGSNTWKVALCIHRHPQINDFSKILNFRGELDLTLDKEFITTDEIGLPLIRGSHIRRFRLVFSRRPREYVHDVRFIESQASRRTSHIQRTRIACQQVSNRTQRWRLKFALIEPPKVLANSCNYIIPVMENPRLLYYLLGVLNSTLLNWRFKLSSTNNHVSNREIGYLPLVDPDTKEEKTKLLVDEIVNTVRNVVNGSGDMSRRLDALVFSLYGVEISDTRHILREMGALSDEISDVALMMEGLRDRYIA